MEQLILASIAIKDYLEKTDKQTLFIAFLILYIVGIPGMRSNLRRQRWLDKQKKRKKWKNARR